ncbi:MAG: hypothetical protein PHF86_00835 [Candidatus Nanoarchaeia archaeon]|nr:hypothetical protein [Candidatus Nanoarchaeia archaeon]
MRAKIINEIQHFERGLDPKESMDIGGINVSKIWNEIIEEPLKKWNKFIKSFEGKIISGKFINTNTLMEVNTTIKVEEALPGGAGEIMFRGREKGSDNLIEINTFKSSHSKIIIKNQFF